MTTLTTPTLKRSAKRFHEAALAAGFELVEVAEFSYKISLVYERTLTPHPAIPDGPGPSAFLGYEGRKRITKAVGHFSPDTHGFTGADFATANGYVRSGDKTLSAALDALAARTNAIKNADRIEARRAEEAERRRAERDAREAFLAELEASKSTDYYRLVALRSLANAPDPVIDPVDLARLDGFAKRKFSRLITAKILKSMAATAVEHVGSPSDGGAPLSITEAIAIAISHYTGDLRSSDLAEEAAAAVAELVTGVR